jgi:hypothetical protein
MHTCPLLASKGRLVPLLVPITNNGGLGPSLTNPSILTNQSTGSVWINLRNLNYVLYHSEHNNFEHPWGPIIYLHPESEHKLKTINVFCKLNNDLSGIEWSSIIDTSMLDVEPMWEFHGLEDGRLVEWEGKTYICGVRRDTTPNGVGRMELSELAIDEQEKQTKEISRYRIPIPGPNPDASYCEKNWVPILDRPYEFVKWSNPTEVVKAAPPSGPTITTHLGEFIPGASRHDWRGGSQLLRVGDVYVHIVHETNLYFTELKRKDATYRHRILIRDVETFEIVGRSDPFSFMGGKVEFCCGLAYHPYDPNNLLITFGFQDNASYLLDIPTSELLSLCHHK